MYYSMCVSGGGSTKCRGVIFHLFLVGLSKLCSWEASIGFTNLAVEQTFSQRFKALQRVVELPTIHPNARGWNTTKALFCLPVTVKNGRRNQKLERRLLAWAPGPTHKGTITISVNVWESHRTDRHQSSSSIDTIYYLRVVLRSHIRVGEISSRPTKASFPISGVVVP